MLRGDVRKVVGESRLEGRLVDDAGNPVSGARVAFGHGIAPIASDADGRFAFENLAHGRYRISAELDDLHAWTSVGTGRMVDVVMARRPMLRLFVRDGDTPVAGADILLDRVIATTDTNGFARIPAYGGLSTVTVVADGYAPARVATAPDVDGELPDERHVRLQRGAPISGVVIGPDQQPVANASVRMLAKRGGQKLRANQTGVWETRAIAGRYQIVASSDTQLETTPVVVEHDGTTPRRDIVVHTIAGAELGAAVYDEQGKPCEAIVYAMPRAERELPKLARCDARGNAALAGLVPGLYDLFAVTDDHASKQVEVTLVAGQRKDFDITVEPGHAIAGTVVDRNGTPVPNAEVHVATKSLHGTVSDSAGRFHLGGMPDSSRGTYHLTAKPFDGDWVSSSAHCDARPGDTALVIVLPSPTRVVGTVRFDGTPMPHFAVALGVNGLPQIFRTDTGCFQVALQRPVRLQILGPGTSREVIEISAPTPGAVIDVGVIELRRGLHIRGRVVDEHGTGVPRCARDDRTPRSVLRSHACDRVGVPE